MVASDGHQFVHIVDGASTAEVVARFGKALEHGADGFGAGETLDEFIGNVTHFEAGEHEGIGFAGDGAAGGFAGAH